GSVFLIPLARKLFVYACYILSVFMPMGSLETIVVPVPEQWVSCVYGTLVV
ncbi:hypothetical protein A2U01_0078740, partial [Trifolium medium]|nr:hypothetical protein [Trifolium medium]